MVSELVVEEENGKKVIKGIKIREGLEYRAKTVIIATGTFLRGLIHIGEINFSAGRMGELSSEDLPLSLEKIGLKLGRFKTGTPTRIDGRTIDYSVLEEQPGDKSQVLKFSNRTKDEDALNRRQIPCYIAHTNEKVHEIIRNAKERSPLFNGTIQGLGPRYCPSIEDKIFRYPDKNQHHLFLEREGYDTNEIYLGGLSSSLPVDVQEEMLKNIKGFENANIVRNGYAIEYDCIDARQLKDSLEFRNLEGLFAAGQFNGSSGYEEAAVQGLMAGINAAMKVLGREPVIIGRDQGYIGVLIDDLVTKESHEPYRMMTSRSEYRLLLRQDNADLRLTKIGYKVGLISEERYNSLLEKEKQIANEVERLKNIHIGATAKVQDFLVRNGSTPLQTSANLAELIRRPELNYDLTAELDDDRKKLRKDVRDQVNINIKYEGYIKRQESQVKQFKKLENKKIPPDIDYSKVKSLRIEAVQKLGKVRPSSVGQASRISGVSPADITVLLVYLETYKEKRDV